MDRRLVSIWAGQRSRRERGGQGSTRKGGDSVHRIRKRPDTSFFHRCGPRSKFVFPVANEEEAKKILLDLEARVDPDELTPKGNSSLWNSPIPILPESDEQTSQPLDSSDNWDDDDPVAEVWNGDKEELADTLKACLAGNWNRITQALRGRPLAPGGSSGAGIPRQRNCPRSRGSKPAGMILVAQTSVCGFPFDLGWRARPRPTNEPPQTEVMCHQCFPSFLTARRGNDHRCNPHRRRARCRNHGQRHRARLRPLRLHRDFARRRGKFPRLAPGTRSQKISTAK